MIQIDLVTEDGSRKWTFQCSLCKTLYELWEFLKQ